MFLEIPLDPIKNWVQVAASAGSILALGAAAFWFFRTSKAKQRIQFDLDCKIYPLAGTNGEKVAEIQFCFENKGFVEHRIYDLSVSIHALASEDELETKEKTGELQFTRRILGRKQLIPPIGKYYFIRPGIRQVVTHIVPVDARASLIRVTAGFYYVERGAYPHTARRVFPAGPVPSEGKPRAAI
ncbi:MAG TPA: hypothetical protein VFD98_11155 [Terracidiphilus sp.]|jgi:hypothetical protein|nr:hypothetical protein [Terracidiphilus sp.]